MPEIKKLPSREKQHGVIRPMTTMEDWEDRALAAYESTNPIKRLDMLPDFGPGLMTRALKGKQLYHAMVRPESKGQVPFRYHDPNFAGKGFGGNVYGKGIHLADAPEHARFWDDIKRRRGEATSTIRTHNLPPQAKMLDVNKQLSVEESKRFIAEAEKRGVDIDFALKDIYYGKPINKTNIIPEEVFLGSSNHEVLKEVVQELGYDGVTASAKKLYPYDISIKNTPNAKVHVIYNYDIINNPRKVAIERGFKKAE